MPSRVLASCLVLWSCIALGACADDEGGGAPPVTTLNEASNPAVLETETCSERAKWVYLVSERAGGGSLLRFRPDTLALEVIGDLKCPTGGIASPHSMAVDRSATAWVLYNEGNRSTAYRVSTKDARCDPDGRPLSNETFGVFGMGFVSDGPIEETAAETLFVAGGQGNLVPGSSGVRIPNTASALGAADREIRSLEALAQVGGWPELTGTGAGELWGFFPRSFESPQGLLDTTQNYGAEIKQIDKNSGKTVKRYRLDVLGNLQAKAWAFAHWGGSFYVFLQEFGAPSSSIWRLDPASGAFDQVKSTVGFTIVGAGVSTCAPTAVLS